MCHWTVEADTPNLLAVIDRRALCLGFLFLRWNFQIAVVSSLGECLKKPLTSLGSMLSNSDRNPDVDGGGATGIKLGGLTTASGPL